MVKPEELKVVKVMTRLPAGVKTAEDFLKLVRRQNEGVDTTKWATLNLASDGYLILGLDEPSVEKLDSRNFRLAVGVGQATFKLLDRKNTKTGGKALGKVQQSS